MCLTLNGEVDSGRFRLEVFADHSSDLTLPLASVPVLDADNLQAAAVGRGPRGRGGVSEPSGLGRDALAERVDVAVGRLPQAEDGFRRCDASEADVGLQSSDPRGRDLEAGGPDVQR